MHYYIYKICITLADLVIFTILNNKSIKSRKELIIVAISEANAALKSPSLPKYAH